jgi:metal-responsive CopG/Arc/MetJ family transcriptional regulator
MIRVNAIFEAPFLKQMSDFARRQRLSRSELIRRAVADYIERYKLRQEEDILSSHREEASLVQDSLRRKSGEWDGGAVIRRWRESR